MAETSPYLLVKESIDTLEQKKNLTKTVNNFARDTVKALGLDKSYNKTIKNCKKHYMTMGKGWIDNNPLVKDPQEENPDTVSPIFVKLKDIILEFAAIGAADKLVPYLEAVKEFGIDIDISGVMTGVEPDQAAEIESTIDSMTRYQKQADTLDKQLKEEDCKTSEELNFAPKNKYLGIVSLYKRKLDGKEIDDDLQTQVSDLIMTQKALDSVYNDFANE